MTRPHQHKVYLQARKGFVKLALEYGTDLVPMYAFGENELYETSDFLMGFRMWWVARCCLSLYLIVTECMFCSVVDRLQKTFHIGIPVVFGWKNTLIPLAKPLGIEVGHDFVMHSSHDTTLIFPLVFTQIGAPVQVSQKPREEITSEDVDRVHAEFMAAMTKLFERTKQKHGVGLDVKLDIC